MTGGSGEESHRFAVGVGANKSGLGRLYLARVSPSATGLTEGELESGMREKRVGLKTTLGDCREELGAKESDFIEKGRAFVSVLRASCSSDCADTEERVGCCGQNGDANAAS